jgi:menaquinone-dependent protoporphyrinogen oxidase
MADILVVYGTSYGQTAKIVRRIADRLTTEGHRVSICRGDALPSEQTLDDFDAVLVAGSVLYGKHQPYVRDFVRRNVRRLNAAPSAFLSVCGALAGSWSKGQLEARKYIERFLAETGWQPQVAKSFAGGLPYTRYRFFTRWMMRLISRQTGRPTDTSRDWEFTDWDAVDRFALQFSGLVRGPAAAVR